MSERDQFQVTPRPPQVQAPMIPAAQAQDFIKLGACCVAEFDLMCLYNTARQFRAGNLPPQAMAMFAAVGMIVHEVSVVIERLAPSREDATPEEVIAELPEWASEIMKAVGLIQPDQPQEEPPPEDLAARAAQSNLVIAR